MLWVVLMALPEQGLVSLGIMSKTAKPLILELVLVQEDTMMTTTRVETRQHRQIMGANTSKPWDTSWCSDKGDNELSLS